MESPEPNAGKTEEQTGTATDPGSDDVTDDDLYEVVGETTDVEQALAADIAEKAAASEGGKDVQEPTGEPEAKPGGDQTPAESAEEPTGHDRDKGLQALQQRLGTQERQMGELRDDIGKVLTSIEGLAKPAADAVDELGHPPTEEETPTQDVDQAIADALKGVDAFEQDSLETGLTKAIQAASKGGGPSDEVANQLKELSDRFDALEEQAETTDRQTETQRFWAKHSSETGISQDRRQELITQAETDVAEYLGIDEEQQPEQFRDALKARFWKLSEAEPKTGGSGSAASPRKQPSGTPAGAEVIPDGAAAQLPARNDGAPPEVTDDMMWSAEDQ